MADGGVQSLRDRVEQTIAGSGELVVNRVVDAFVDAEIKKRADILTAGVNTIRQLEADLRKIKPDVVHVDETGANVSNAYTPAKQKELVRQREKIKRLDGAISTVLEKHDADSFNKLEQAIKKASSKGGDKGDDDGDSGSDD